MFRPKKTVKPARLNYRDYVQVELEPDQLIWQFAKIFTAWDAPTEWLLSSAALSCETLCLNGVIHSSITTGSEQRQKHVDSAFQECFNWISGNDTKMPCQGEHSQHSPENAN